MLLHKLRRAMVNAAREPLHGDLEIDDTWIGAPQAGLRGSRQLKDRRAALVLAAVEKRGTTSGRVRMAVIPDFKAATLTAFIKQHVTSGSTIYTDGLKQFSGLPVAGFKHVARTQPLREDLRKGARSWSRWRTGRSATFSNGRSEPTMVSVERSCRCILTSSRSGTTGGASS